MSEHQKKMRICIVGCGPSAMSALYHFTKLPEEVMPEIVCYEKQSTWGGMWNLTWRTGTDESGEHVHACMYYDLWTNNPKEMTEFPEYTYEKHFGKPVPSFVPGPVLKDYIEGRCERESKRDLCQYVRFNTVVRWIDYNKDSDVFVVKAKNLKEDQDIEECFTHVIIATGLFGHAYVPTFPGLDRFQGQIIHAKEVRRAKHFQDKRVLLIGSGLSALDLILQFIKYGASKVIMSYHRQPTRLKMPEGAEERPPVEKFSETKAYFQDGAEAEIDIVIFCTGYRLHHSFLPENLRIQPEMNIYPDHLYKGIVWMKDGNMKFLYLGVLYTTYFLTILDVQALWACQFIMSTGKPTMQEMEADVETYIEERNKVVNSWNIPNFIKFVVKYLSAMIKDTGYQLDVSKAEAVLMEHVKYISEDLSTYRDRRYKSIYTGQLSAKPTLPWMKDFREISDIMSYSY